MCIHYLCHSGGVKGRCGGCGEGLLLLCPPTFFLMNELKIINSLPLWTAFCDACEGCGAESGGRGSRRGRGGVVESCAVGVTIAKYTVGWRSVGGWVLRLS